MDVDRALQKKILERLKAIYPAKLDSQNLSKELHSNPKKLSANAIYLAEHDLVDLKFRLSSDGQQKVLPFKMSITAAGIDFLEEDGGLGAILKVMTVKLHADTIRDLILAQIEAAEVETSVKEQLKTSVKNLPAKGLEAVLTRLAQEGLTRLPNAMQLLQSAISAAQ